MKKVLIAAAVSAVFASVAPLASAETAESTAESPVVVAQASPRGADAAGAPRAAPSRPAFAMPSERVEARLAYVRTALKITDAQQPQWENFASVLRKHARAMDQRFAQRRAEFDKRRDGAQRPERPNVTAIERLERTQQRMAERSTRLNEVIAAAKPLYATLSPEQKQVADSMLAQQGRGGHHRRHHRGMHGGPSV